MAQYMSLTPAESTVFTIAKSFIETNVNFLNATASV